jgi:large subunit ribosomal protein L24
MGSCLDKILRKKYEIRTLEVKKGDEIKVMRGKFKKKSGKVLEVDRDKMRVSVEGLNITKKDGNKIQVWIHPSKIKIIKLNEDDKRRFKKKVEEKNAQKNK